MTEHRYTLAEIDRMRAALWRKYNPPERLRKYESMTIDGGTLCTWPTEEDREAKLRVVVEDQLRTYLLAGIRPEELEASK